MSDLCLLRTRDGARCCATASSRACRCRPAIDFLEVSADQRTLLVTFFEDIPADGSGNPSHFGLGNLQIDGGVRVQGIQASELHASGKVLSVKVDQTGDFSTYTLRIVAEAGSNEPPAGFDPLLSQVDFSFKVDCPAGFDCEEPAAAARRADALTAHRLPGQGLRLPSAG